MVFSFCFFLHDISRYLSISYKLLIFFVIKLFTVFFYPFDVFKIFDKTILTPGTGDFCSFSGFLVFFLFFHLSIQKLPFGFVNFTYYLSIFLKYYLLFVYIYNVLIFLIFHSSSYFIYIDLLFLAS